MKLIQRLSLFASIALVAIACDIQQTFDDRINDKQLLVLAPDFADTSVQLVFRDPETLAVIDEDFEVTVYANKRLIDANGNYKNEFIARGGVMEFFVSPEETVSEGDPLYISINTLNSKTNQKLMDDTYEISSEGFHTMVLGPGNQEQSESNIDLDILPQKNNNLNKTTQSNLFLRIDNTNNPNLIERDNFRLLNISNYPRSVLDVPINDECDDS